VAELKTKPTNASVNAFINKIPDKQTRADCFAIAKLMREITGDEPKMWGPRIVGFGTITYKNARGKGVDWPVTGFSPRKQNLTLYIMTGFDAYDELMPKLGKYCTGKACLYIKRLSDVHVPTLKRIITRSVKYMRKNFP
jgi:hypothetical protein